MERVERTFASIAMAFVLAVAVPASVAQAPATLETGPMVIVTVRVPLSPGALGTFAAEGGNLSIPFDGGQLDVILEAVPMPGPGGVVDADAYLAQARLLLPSGVTVPLPSLVIRPDAGTIDDPTAAILQDLARQAGELTAQGEALHADLRSQAEDAQGDAAKQWSDAEALAAAFAQEAAWVQALAEAAAGTVSEGASEQVAVANALLAHAQSGLRILDAALDDVRQMMPPAPGVPTPVTKRLADVEDAIAQAQAKSDKARAALEEQAGAVAAKVDRLVDEQAVIDGARAAAAGALQMLDAAAAGAQAAADAELQTVQDRLAELQALVASQAERRKVQEAAAAAADALAEVAARMQWAMDWTQAAREWGAGTPDAALAQAANVLESAQSTLDALDAIVAGYEEEQVQPGADSALQAADALVEQTAQALESAQAGLAAALDSLGKDLPGGLDPMEDGGGGAPDAREALTVCVDAAAFCFNYEPPAETDRSIVVLVAVPMAVAPALPGAPGVPGLPGVPGVGGPPGVGLPGGQTSTGTSAPPPPAAEPAFTIRVNPDPLRFEAGQQQVAHATVKNTGNAADRVRVTVQANAPLAADGGDSEGVILQPGDEAVFDVRLTPTAAGSGTVTFTAAGDLGEHASREVAATVAGAATMVKADLAVSVDPVRLQGTVGSRYLVQVHVTNEAQAADTVSLAASGSGLSIEMRPASVTLPAGESVTMQLQVAPSVSGQHTLQLALTSANGAHLRPVVPVEATPAAPGLAPDDGSTREDSGQDPGGATTGTSKGTPGAGWVVVGGALAVCAVMARRRRA